MAGSRPASAAIPPAGIYSAAVVAQPAPAQSESHTEIFDWINLIILIVVLVYLLRKPIAHFFIRRSGEIESDLEKGRKALEAAQAQLAAAEEKMNRLEQDIAALRETAGREIEAERGRLRAESEREAERIQESARHTIEAATQAAKLELKEYAAREAIQLAEQMIRQRLDGEGRARLVSRFVQGIHGNGHSKSDA
ncbi:MAG TPA: ATP synthase F0 subunit B [Terriglobia bacterium]|nr:ATP synthase F0 subunit B [Terriglobia bacterium]